MKRRERKLLFQCNIAVRNPQFIMNFESFAESAIWVFLLIIAVFLIVMFVIFLTALIFLRVALLIKELLKDFIYPNVPSAEMTPEWEQFLEFLPVSAVLLDWLEEYFRILPKQLAHIDEIKSYGTVQRYSIKDEYALKSFDRYIFDKDHPTQQDIAREMYKNKSIEAAMMTVSRDLKRMSDLINSPLNTKAIRKYRYLALYFGFSSHELDCEKCAKAKHPEEMCELARSVFDYKTPDYHNKIPEYMEKWGRRKRHTTSYKKADEEPEDFSIDEIADPAFFEQHKEENNWMMTYSLRPVTPLALESLEAFKRPNGETETEREDEIAAGNTLPAKNLLSRIEAGIMDDLAKFDVEKDRDKIESYCTLLNLDFEKTVRHIKARQTRLLNEKPGKK